MTYDQQKLKIFLSHRRALVDYALPITGCLARAEDVVQDAYLRFFPTVLADPAVESVPYLYRVVRNLALDLVRRGSMEQRHHAAGAADGIMPGAYADPETHTVCGDEVKRLEQVLAALPEQQRIAVQMHRVGGYRLVEIATHLDVSVATAHRLVRRAMLTIALALGEVGDDSP